MARRGVAWLGVARLGVAWQGKARGRAESRMIIGPVITEKKKGKNDICDHGLARQG